MLAFSAGETNHKIIRPTKSRQAAFRVLFIRFATSLLGFSADLSMSGAGRVPRPCASAYASNEPTHFPKYQSRQHTT